jgi:hypothetical protein
MTQNIETLTLTFQPIVGYIAWLVRRVDGSILTMQFGEPHLTMREAVSASRGSSGHSKIAPDPYPSELPKPDIPYILEL